MVELQHYEANAASAVLDLDELPATGMPTNTRLQVAVTPDEGEVK